MGFITKITDVLPGGKMRRLRRQLAQPDFYVIDLMGVSSHTASQVMFTDFRSTYSLAERKAFKVAALLELLHFFFTRLDPRVGMPECNIPANTVFENTFVSFYAHLEKNCVQLPGAGFDLENEWRRFPTLMYYILDDLNIIFNGQIPKDIQDKVARIGETHFGTRKPSSPDELALWVKITSDAAWGFWHALRSRRELRSETYDQPKLLVHVVLEEIRGQIESLEASSTRWNTELVRRVG